jgi:hypothetical protein
LPDACQFFFGNEWAERDWLFLDWLGLDWLWGDWGRFGVFWGPGGLEAGEIAAGGLVHAAHSAFDSSDHVEGFEVAVLLDERVRRLG